MINIILLLILITIIKCYSFNINKIIINNIKRSNLVLSSSVMQSTISSNILNNFDYNKNNKLPWIPSGYKTYNYNKYKINYVDLGGGKDKPPILLIHGFGASVFHWRLIIL
jgi:hypothetical protein